MTLDASQDRAISLETLGQFLRQTREARGLSLAEVSHDIHVRTVYLEGIEQGDMSRLPEPVYVRGFVKRYADYLGLDSQELLIKTDPILLKTKPRPELTQPPQQESFAVSLRPIHLWSAYVVLVVLAVGGLSAFLEGRLPSVSQWTAFERTGSSNPRPNSGSANSGSANSGSNEPDLPVPSAPRLFPRLEDWVYVEGVFPERSPNLIALTNTVQLDVRIVERPSWIRVVADGATVFEGTLAPGTQQNWSAEDSIVLRAGNAGGVQVTFNNRDLGPMGQFGEVREETYRRPDQAAQAL
ncbi:MAG: helix-turn-helix domain-containing protein [Synechococcaceae cyanobacterium RM1_1_27]|nr:helix-turn-helix domain-containing protein [Synechococcaceae cyanobacterium RM1_1_27]